MSNDNYISSYSGSQVDNVLGLFHGKGLDQVTGLVQRNADGTFSAGENDVFIAEYSITTNAELSAAINAGKTIILTYRHEPFLCTTAAISGNDVYLTIIMLSFSGSGTSKTSTITEQWFWINSSDVWTSSQPTTVNVQEKLSSGTNIKTINNTSLLGSGDLTIGGNVDDVTVNGTSVVTNKVAQITTPTKTSDLTNDSNFQNATQVDTAINTRIASVYKAKGSVAFLDLPALTSSNEGFVYDVNESFTTTSDFVEGAGVTYPAGTNVVIIDIGSGVYKYDVLAGLVDLSGKQDLLVSGTNIKRINGKSVLGSGNLTIEDCFVVYPNYTTYQNIISYIGYTIFIYLIDEDGIEYFKNCSYSRNRETATVYLFYVDDNILTTWEVTSENTWTKSTVNLQQELVSGTNIKTINNNSLLGSGNLTISGGLQNLIDGSVEGSVRSVNSAEEDSTYTMGTNAFSEGRNTKASGPTSHAEGSGSTASGNYSHAEGRGTTASGLGSHTEGYYTEARGMSSHAQNHYTIAAKDYQTVIGKWNLEDTETIEANQKAFIIGNGSNNNRSNALTVDWSGNVDIASGASYKINGTPLSASDVGAQSTLVSGTNIKTINNQSLLGSGDISIGTVTSIATGSGLTGGPITSSGTISLATAFGDSINPYGSKTANYVLAAPNGSSGTPLFRALVADDLPNGNWLNGSATGSVRTNGSEEEDSNYTIGSYAVAQGKGTQATAYGSHAQNIYTEANYEAQTAIGKFNDNQSDNAFEIGNGDSTTPSNAFTVGWDGNVKMALDTSAVSGVDKDIYDALISLGWDSDVIINGLFDEKEFYKRVALYLLQSTKIGAFLYGDGTDNYVFNSGSKTISGLSDYALLAIKPNSAATWMLAYNNNNAVRGSGATSTGSDIQLFSCNLTRSGNTLTYGSCGWTYANGNNTYHSIANGIACIIGILPIVGGNV